MKKLLFFLALLPLLWGANALAAPCVTAALSSYTGLGAAGCTIGGASFSGFGLLQEPTGALPFSSVTVTPVSVGSSVGLDFGLNVSARGSQLFETLVAYRVSGLAADLAATSVSLGGSSFAADGGVTAVQNYCFGGSFAGADGLSGCSGSGADSLIVFNTSGGASLSDSLAGFAPVGSLAVVTDIAVDGGVSGSGSASLASASNRFELAAVGTVPEPGTLLLFAAGLPALLVLARSRRLPARPRPV